MKSPEGGSTCTLCGLVAVWRHVAPDVSLAGLGCHQHRVVIHRQRQDMARRLRDTAERDR